MSNWTEVKARWSASWKALQQQAVKQWGAAIRKRPQDFAPHVAATVAELRAAREHLDAMKPLLPRQLRSEGERQLFSQFSALSRRYYELAAGIYAEAEEPSVSGGPLLVVAGIALGVAGIAWAVAAYQYARNLREQTALAHEELAARVEASKEGRELAPSTLPPPAPTQSKMGWLIVAGLTLTAGALVVPALVKGK